jgi:hypothetical protein
VVDQTACVSRFVSLPPGKARLRRQLVLALGRLPKRTLDQAFAYRVGPVLGPGDNVPDSTVWMAPREPAICSNLVAGRSALFLFFLFAWSST